MTVLRMLLAPLLLAAGLVTLGPAAPANAWEDVADFIWLTEQSPSEDLEGWSDLGRFRFHDGDLDPALSGLSVVVSSSTDPTGIRVLTSRTSRADPYYRGAVRFSSEPSDQDAGRLRVSDGDTVTVTYMEPRDRYGKPQVRTAMETWRARTRPPDWREVGFVDPADGPGTVRGAQRSAPPGSTVRIYDPSSSVPALTSTADEGGRFLVSAATDLPPAVRVTAQEPGLGESPAIEVARARLTGRVVLPGAAGDGVRSGIVELRGTDAQGCPAECPTAVTLSDRDGFFYLLPRAGRVLPAGGYDLSVHFQGLMDAARAEWDSAAYGHPAPVAVTLSGGEDTAVLTEVHLEPPVFHGEVRDSVGLPVVEAQVDVFDAAGQLVTNAYSRTDGRFALHREDGNYRLRVIGPVGCVRYSEAWIDVSVQEGVASPSAATATIDPVGIHQDVWTIPLDPPEIGVTVRLDGPGVEITLRQPEGAGTVSIRCTSARWDDMEVLNPPVDLHWDAGFDAATVCLDYDPARLAAAGVAEADVELLHRERDGSVSSIATRHDLVADTVCGETTSFSPFALAVPREEQPEPPSSPSPQARTPDDSCPSGRVPEDGFADVSTENPHEPNVDCAVWWSVANGRTPTQYNPGDPVSRAQMATFLVNLLHRTGDALPPANRDWFTDDTGNAHESSINRLAEAGIVLGRADGRYAPDLPVMRDAMATFLVRTYEQRSGHALTATLDWFTDDEGNVHELSINSAADAGFTGGAASGGYAPALPVKRDQMASFLVRVLDMLVEQTHAAPPA